MTINILGRETVLVSIIIILLMLNYYNIYLWLSSFTTNCILLLSSSKISIDGDSFLGGVIQILICTRLCNFHIFTHLICKYCEAPQRITWVSNSFFLPLLCNSSTGTAAQWVSVLSCFNKLFSLNQRHKVGFFYFQIKGKSF